MNRKHKKIALLALLKMMACSLILLTPSCQEIEEDPSEELDRLVKLDQNLPQEEEISIQD